MLSQPSSSQALALAFTVQLYKIGAMFRLSVPQFAYPQNGDDNAYWLCLVG